MATASPDDVRVEIETYLDDPAITAIISRVDRDITREMDDPPATDTDDRQDLEAVLTAIHITTTRDRAESRVQSGRTSVTYEEELVDQLRSRARRLGAPDSLLGLDGGKRTSVVSVPDAKGWDGA